MTRDRIALAFLLACVVAAPFFKSFLQRRGASAVRAYLGGFAILGVGIIVVRIAHG